MRELSLFTGAGGGLLGSLLLGHRPIGYVEWDDYCQRVIAARIHDGILPDAPIFGDIKTFISEGYAASYTGMVDVLSAGFPCQPFSVAGKQKGAADERNMWPATAECIGIVRPRFLLLENVPGIRSYLPVVIRDLRRLGYEVSRPLILGADDVGAPHRRKRVWIFGYSVEVTGEAFRSIRSGKGSNTGRGYFFPPNSISIGTKRYQSEHGPRRMSPENDCTSPDSPSRETYPAEPGGFHAEPRGEDRNDPNADPKRLEGGGSEQSLRQSGQSDRVGGDEEWTWAENWPEVAARLCRVDDGVAHRVDRLKALGNGQVPQVVATAWRILTA